VLGECYEAKGKYADAAEYYRRALAIHPDSYLLHRLLTASEKRLQQSQAPEVDDEQHGGRILDEVQEGGIPRTSSESGVEFMLRRLSEAKGASTGSSSPSVSNDAGKKLPSSSRIVTVTLAEIYASQGEYLEALHAYRQLVEQRPEEADRFQHRLAELEELARLQKGSN
jgi:tetratricopeptide (TPR) repeat protein